MHKMGIWMYYLIKHDPKFMTLSTEEKKKQIWIEKWTYISYEIFVFYVDAGLLLKYPELYLRVYFVSDSIFVCVKPPDSSPNIGQFTTESVEQ